MEYWSRARDRSLGSRVDDAYQDYVQAIELEHDTIGYQDDLARFYLSHLHCYRDALESVDGAIAESGPETAYEDLILHLLKAEICAALGNWTQTLSTLEYVTGVVRHFLIDLDWHGSAEASPPESVNRFCERLRSQLLQCIQASDRLTRTMGGGKLHDRAQSLLKEQRTLWKVA